MNDPFFDEDDGEFDDLYGNPPPSTSSPALRSKTRNNDVPPRAPTATHDAQSVTWSPVASVSAYARDRVSSTTSSITTDLAGSGKQEKKRNKRGKTRHKGSQKLFDVQWESDVNVDKCRLCKSDFSLVRRRHHCRHCGRIMCSDCTSFLYFELSRRKHRVCSTCNKHLLAEQDAYERETMVAGDTTAKLVADSSDGGRPASAARIPKSNDDIDNARKKQKENSRQAPKRRDTLQKQRGTAKGPTTATTSLNQASVAGNERTEDEVAVSDSSDEDWFNDVSDEQMRSRESVEVYSVDGGSKEPGWRDRVKDTYTVTPATTQASVDAPTAEQFRYEMSGLGRGLDDGRSSEMPRPKQQIATSTNTDRIVNPSKLSGNGYFSEQFQYDDVGGPGLGHDDDRPVAMPRPKQILSTTPYIYKSGRRSPEPYSTDDSTSNEQGFQTRPTFTDMFSATRHQESKAKRRERKEKASKPQARGNQNTTLNELNSSHSSQDGSRTLAPTVPNLNTAQLTFYDQDADKLVVDESPGFFEGTMIEREAQHKKEEEQNEQLARDMASLPRTVQPHRFSSEQDSYSIVHLSSHTSNSPIGYQRDDANDTGVSGKTKSSFTGALKRFLGMGSKKPITLPKAAKTPRAAVVAPPKQDVAKNHPSPVPGVNYHDSTITTDSVSVGLLRHTIVDYNGVYREEPIPQANFRNTMTPHVDSNFCVEMSLPSQVGELKRHYQKQEPERKRRGTFDELFMSPKDNLAIAIFSDRFSTEGAARDEETTYAGQTSFGAVGVARFDQRRPVDKAEECVLGNGPLSVVPSSQPADHSTDAWRASAALSVLNDKEAATQSEEFGFTWSNIGLASELGTATYAVPMSHQSRAVYSETTGMSAQYEAPAARGSIMDDLKYGSALKMSQGEESFGDFFAAFEETNDYVFDSTTGGYVASRVPKRAVATGSVKQLKSPRLLVPEDVNPRMSGHGYNDPSPIPGTIIGPTGDGEEVEDDVAEIIVDKISSLEDELAALKQLIRIRKGSEKNQPTKPRVSLSTAKPTTRKESIFDNGNSDEDNGKNALYASSIRPVVERGSKRRPGSEKKFVKTRKNSFADLFEDSPNEDKVFGGTTSYEALFQTETKLMIEISKEDVSDDNGDPIRAPKTRAAKSRHSSHKTNDFVLSDDTDSEPELTSLKERRGILSSRRKTRANVDDSSIIMNKGKLVTTPLRLSAKQDSTKEQAGEDDPIDALFDTSKDRDVIKLYSHDGEDIPSWPESNVAPVSKGKSVLVSQESSSDAEASGSPAAITANTESVAPVSKANASDSYSLDLQGLDEADEEEELLINWSKMREIRPRRQKHPAASNVGVKNNVTDSTTKDTLLEPSLFSEDSDLTVNDFSAEHAVSTVFPADASSSWMSLGALEDETTIIKMSGDFKSLPVHESKHMTKSATKAVATNENKRDDGADVVSVPASMNPVMPSSEADKGVLTEEAGGPGWQAHLALVDAFSDTNENVVRREHAAFDIFDKSGDVEFSSISSPMGLEISDPEVGNDGENNDKESLVENDEAFSFEIKAPKKQSSVDVPTTIYSPHYSMSSPASTSDGVEFGKYATFPVQPSSRTSSIDGSVDDPEDSVADDDLVLRKDESQAFDTDWQQMQAEEKERKKRLQVKQRQAQRDKLLRKQGTSTKSLSGSTATHGSSKSKLKSGKKKKKDKAKDDVSSSSSHHKKSGSSRNYRRNATDSALVTPSEPPRLLTEL